MKLLVDKPHRRRNVEAKRTPVPGRPADLVSVVIPTYKEAQNLVDLLPAVATAIESAGLAGEIIVVDDASDDGTLEICESFQSKTPVRLIVRRNQRGLATAVVRGLREATGDVLIVMDADFSHPPDAIPSLIDSLHVAEFVIGSRYVEGGLVDESWGSLRNLNSRIATLLARGLTNARDPMAGFFAIRKSTFLRATDLNPTGYKIGLELLVRCRCDPIAEVPIRFADRMRGESKLTLRQQTEYLRHLTRLYSQKYKKLASFMRFGLVGLSGMAVDLTVFAGLRSSMSTGSSRAIAIAAALVWNYIWNRRVTFAERKGQHAIIEFPKFATACLLGAVASWGTSIGLMENFRWLALHPSLAVTAGILVGATVNFFLCSRIVFLNA